MIGLPAIGSVGASIMDKILKSILGVFIEEHELKNLKKEDKQFEYLAAYLIVRKHHAATFNIDDLVVGKGNDLGIDAIAILVNGFLVSEIAELEDIADDASHLDVTFIFVQATRTDGFDAAKMWTFGNGVREFFADPPTLPRNKGIKERVALVKAIYERSHKFSNRRPECLMFYASTAKWTGDPHLEGTKANIENSVTALDCFSSVSLSQVGGLDIEKLYHQDKNAIGRKFNFPLRANIPDIEGVKESFTGLISATDLLAIIRNEDGTDLLKSIFYDNVRDWLGESNSVNGEIKKTLNTDTRRHFPLMNNGITIIAKSLQHHSEHFTIKDFQIVNGCQTCHAIWEVAKPDLFVDEPLKDVFIPLRLIHTQDEEVASVITRATNRQTPVSDEAFFALEEFPRRLEQYFVAQTSSRRLFYERRTRQYSTEPINKARVVTQSAVARGYAAMFLNEPHSTTRSSKRIRERLGTTIFAADHKYSPYYVVAVATYRLEQLFKTKKIDRKYRSARFHVLMALRLLAVGPDAPKPNSHDMEKYCEKLADVLWGPTANALLMKAVGVVDSAAGGNMDRDAIRTQAVTDRVIEQCGASKKPKSPRSSGA